MPAKILGSGLGDTKALTVDQFFDYLNRLTDEPTKARIYAAVSWVYRCIELRANTLSSIPYKVLRGETELDSFPIILEPLLWELEADLCIFGAGFWLKDRPRTATKALQRLNPQTMKVKTDPKEGIVGFEQHVDGEPKTFKPEQIVYFRHYSPVDDLGPGVSPMQVALEAADLGRNANAWAAQFFAHGAIPAVILHTEQNIPDEELERVKGAWNKLTKGVQRAWRTIVLRKGLKPEVIGQPIKDLAMTELYDQVRSQVAVAFGVPQTMLSDAANYATAKEHRLSFYQDTVLPVARQIQAAMNEQMFKDMGLEFAFEFGSIEAIQKDEAEKADYLKGLVESKIITKDEARDALGYEPIAPEQMDELRPPRPDFTPRAKEPDDEDEDQPEKALSGQALMALLMATEADLDKWERKALAKGADSPFESEFIPPDMAATIREYLAEDSSEDTIRSAFGMARQMSKSMKDAILTTPGAQYA